MKEEEKERLKAEKLLMEHVAKIVNRTSSAEAGEINDTPSATITTDAVAKTREEVNTFSLKGLDDTTSSKVENGTLIIPDSSFTIDATGKEFIPTDALHDSDNV